MSLYCISKSLLSIKHPESGCIGFTQRLKKFYSGRIVDHSYGCRRALIATLRSFIYHSEPQTIRGRVCSILCPLPLSLP